jgi:hypothetical protein
MFKLIAILFVLLDFIKESYGREIDPLKLPELEKMNNNRNPNGNNSY